MNNRGGIPINRGIISHPRLSHWCSTGVFLSSKHESGYHLDIPIPGITGTGRLIRPARTTIPNS